MESFFSPLLIHCCRRRLSSKRGGEGRGGGLGLREIEKEGERERVKLELQQTASTVGFFSLSAYTKRFTTEENVLF